jgi:phosphotransferase system HPr-like phosphotransfer protein
MIAPCLQPEIAPEGQVEQTQDGGDALSLTTQSKRKRILYVDRTYPDGSTASLQVFLVASALGRTYDVDRAFDLDHHVSNMVVWALSSDPYAALVTHVLDRDTPGPSLFSWPVDRYWKSLEIIERIKAAADIPIIAYTGASERASGYFCDCGVDEVITKSGDIQADILHLERRLERWLKDYRKGPPPVPPPVIRKWNGYTTTEVTVTIRTGLSILSAGRLLKRCLRYPGEILASKCGDSGPGEPASLKDPMGTLCLEAFAGSRLRIAVQGEHEEAERLAREIYSALSAKYAFSMDFHRFDKPSNGRTKP